MRILAIETSCDETAIAIADFARAENGVSVRVLAHLISSQAKLHTKFGGVVPNLARREHEKNLVPMLIRALQEARIKKHVSNKDNKKSLDSSFLTLDIILTRETELLKQFKKHIVALPAPQIDAMAVTYGPGLAPALWTGVNFARTLAHFWDKPLIPVNHMAGHFYSAFLEKSGATPQATSYKLPAIRFPVLALLVSGAHTELILMRKRNTFEIVGETRDDAVGEAFDKVARILGLKYPGGPEIARLALKGDPRIYALPRPMQYTKDYDFSFSGLKTAVLYLVRNLDKLTPQKKRDIAASFQAAAIEVLVKKTIRAAKEYGVRTLAAGGGVSANAALRAALSTAVKNELPHSKLLIPDSSLTGDNALMIATAAYITGMKKARTHGNVRADANARLGENPYHSE